MPRQSEHGHHAGSIVVRSRTANDGVVVRADDDDALGLASPSGNFSDDVGASSAAHEKLLDGGLVASLFESSTDESGCLTKPFWATLDVALSDVAGQDLKIATKRVAHGDLACIEGAHFDARVHVPRPHGNDRSDRHTY